MIPQRQHAQISAKIGTARDRFRQIRINLSESFRNTQKKQIEIVPSPFLDSVNYWPALFTAPPASVYPPPNYNITNLSPIMDGSTEINSSRAHRSQGQSSHVSAIFVHAGAGYHSTTNEHIHLGACDRYADLDGG